jgi:hypothetical protein
VSRRQVPDAVTSALAAFSTDGSVTRAGERRWVAWDARARADEAYETTKATAAKPVVMWIVRRFRSAGVRVTSGDVVVRELYNHLDHTALPLVDVHISGRGADRMTVTWSPRHAIDLAAWIETTAAAVTAAYGADGVRP